MLLNQRLLMNLRLAISGFLLGVLAAFMVWAFQWVLESRRELTFGLPGEVTVVIMQEGQIVTPAGAASAQRELKAYLRDRSLALVVGSYADAGRPELVVYDPAGLLSWLPGGLRSPTSSATSGVYLFEGTYSERRWSRSGTAPLLPEGAEVQGVVAAPRGGGHLQWVRRLGPDPLVPAYRTFTISAADPAQVRHVVGLLDRMGFFEQTEQRIPWVMYFVQNPLLFVTVLFLAFGHVCAVLNWSLYLRGRAHELGVRSRLGGRPLRLVGENLLGGLPGLAAGGAVGVGFAGLLVAVVGQVPLTPGDLRTLAGAGAVAVLLTTATWSATLYVVIRYVVTRSR